MKGTHVLMWDFIRTDFPVETKMQVSRSRSRTPSAKRTRSARSASRAPSRAVTFRLPSMRTVAVANSQVGMGASATTVLRTSFFYNATATAGTGIYNGYLKPGSAFDPAGDLAGMQPQMFDQFAAMYNRYKVNSCKIRIKIIGTDGTAANIWSWVCAAYPAVDATALTTYQAAASQQGAKTVSGGFQQVAGPLGVGAPGATLNFDLNHNQVVGAKSDTWDIGATVSADPTSLQFMVLPIFMQANSGGAAKWVFEIDMWQNVTFSQKKNTVDA